VVYGEVYNKYPPVVIISISIWAVHFSLLSMVTPKYWQLSTHSISVLLILLECLAIYSNRGNTLWEPSPNRIRFHHVSKIHAQGRSLWRPIHCRRNPRSRCASNDRSRRNECFPGTYNALVANSTTSSRTHYIYTVRCCNIERSYIRFGIQPIETIGVRHFVRNIHQAWIQWLAL